MVDQQGSFSSSSRHVKKLSSDFTGQKQNSWQDHYSAQVIRTDIDDAYKNRNQIAHGRSNIFKKDFELEKFLIAVRDALYFLDFTAETRVHSIILVQKHPVKL